LAVKMGFKDLLKQRSGLRVDNRKTTSAASLTLRQSLWPLSLVTILFFLWVGLNYPRTRTQETKLNHILGLRIRPPRYAQQALSKHVTHRPNTLCWPPGCVFWVRLCYLDVNTSTKECGTLTLASAYPLASLGYANWILRHFGYKTVFIFGLVLYGIGALCMWPAGLNQSFGGFCGATFVIGSGLGSLETAANPYLTGMFSSCAGVEMY
jgi:FHS family L-fucose permease-like MFS transporter